MTISSSTNLDNIGDRGTALAASENRGVDQTLPLSPAPRPPPKPLDVRIRRFALTILGAAGLFSLLYAKAVPCAFALMFHRPCPGCGSTRAVLCLLHGDVHGMTRFNPLGPVIALLIGIMALQSLVSVARFGDFRDAGEGKIGVVVKRGIFLVFVLEFGLWIARFFGAFGGPVPVG